MSGKETFADFRIKAEVLDGAPAVVAGSVNAFARQPTFDVNMEVKKVQLPQVNPWLREYIKADAEAGKFELYMEFAAADGKFKGYAKPIPARTSTCIAPGEPEQNPLRRIWEGFLDFAAEVLENPEADQVAARIPFSGTIKDPGDQPVRDHCQRAAQRLRERFCALTRRFDHAARREEEPATSSIRHEKPDKNKSSKDKEADEEAGAKAEARAGRQDLIRLTACRSTPRHVGPRTERTDYTRRAPARPRP